ncbi:MAG: transglutaminaseTgpA domain-containing protein [Ardenticatenales bacterium]
MRPPSGWTSIVLVGLMQLCLAWSIENAGWVSGLAILTPVVIGGVVIGAVLSSWRWMPVLIAHGWSAVLGTVCTFYLATGLVAGYESTPSDYGAWSLLDRLAYVRSTYLAWPAVARSGMPLSNAQQDMMALFFTITMALLLWLLAYICTWFAARYISWSGAVLPSGFALVFSLYSAHLSNDSAYVGFFMLCAFLLAARTHLALRKEHWQAERVHHSAGLEFDFLRDSLVLACLAIAFAFVLPGRIQSEVLRNLPTTWSAATSRARALSGRYFPNINYPVRGEGTSFGDAMPLTGSIQLGNAPVFDVALSGQSAVPARYFRMAVFDTWDGQSWRRNADDRHNAAAYDAIGGPWQSVLPITQTVTTLKPNISQLYALGSPARFDVDTSVETAGDGGDVLTVESRQPLSQGRGYEVVSNVSAASVGELDGAERGGDPAWVTARYLQLPEALPARVTDLAATIAGGTTTRWDKAHAIEGYLRREMTYTESIADPPRGRDKADWFLFDTKEGYCDYYSTAFVVLARSQGVPTRLAAGYAGGEPLVGVQGRRLHDYDAHTWPEVFFPGYGWIEFEPTANEQPLDRPSTADDARALAAKPPPASDQSAAPPKDALPPEDVKPPAADQVPPRRADTVAVAVGLGRFWPWLASLLGIVGVVLAGRFWWARPMEGLSAAERSFGRLVRVARWLGVGPRHSETPSEYSRRLAQQIPDAGTEISAITDAYVAERFGRRTSHALSERLEAAWLAVRRTWPATARRILCERIAARRRGAKGDGDLNG